MLSKLERSSEKLLLDPVSTKTKHSSTPNLATWVANRYLLGPETKRILVASAPSEEICFQASCSTISSFTSERTRTRGPPDVLSPSAWVVKESVSIPKKGPRREIKHGCVWSDDLVTELAREALTRGSNLSEQNRESTLIIPKYVHTHTYLWLEELFLWGPPRTPKGSRV